MMKAIVSLFEHPANNAQKPSNIVASMLKTPITGVDSSTVFTLSFETADGSDGSDGLAAQAILSCSITLPAPSPGVTIRCEGGTITIQPPIFAPVKYAVKYEEEGTKPEEKEFKYVGTGWHFQVSDSMNISFD